MTIDGSNDDVISIDSVDKYAYTDADTGDLPDLYVRDYEAEEEGMSDKDTDEGGEKQGWEEEEQQQESVSLGEILSDVYDLDQFRI